MEKPRPHRNAWIGIAVVAGILAIGLLLAYAGGGAAGGAGGY